MAHQQDFFRVYNGSTVVAESFNSGRACDAADLVAKRHGRARIMLVTATGEVPTNLPIASVSGSSWLR
jgi:hypothetical protein